MRLADRLDAAAAEGRFSPRLVPGLWAALKLAIATLASPGLGAWVGVRSASNHRRAKELIGLFPDLVETIGAGELPDYPLARVRRLPASERWFISSDLHRAPRGYLDWPTRQGSASVYEEALDSYSAQGWGLIENGDIEEYWLVGGSAYGVVYDMARMVASLLPASRRRQLRQLMYAEHFRRIASGYAATFERVRDGFHLRGRFVRLVGNHDDIYEGRVLARILDDELPGLEPADFVVMESDGQMVGLVAHGHQVDGWNGPAVPNRIARFTSSLGSAIQDLPIIPAEPGMPTPDETDAVWEGRLRNRLTRVNGLFGATSGFDSLDEVLLFESWRRRWGEGDDVRSGPYLIFGHTHIPLSAPSSPRGGVWWRYLNSGSGIMHQMVTGVEWDGSTGGLSPDVRLVAWSRETADPHGRLARLVLERDPTDGTLVARREPLA